MRLSDLLAEHPNLDPDVQVDEGEMVLDLVVLGRVLDPEQEPGEARIVIGSSDHTDGVVRRGLLLSTLEVYQAGWTQG